MPFTLLIVEPTDQRAQRTPEAGLAAYQGMLDFGAALMARGVLLASQSLTSQAGGARVQVRGGTLSRVDGPFAEAKEMVGGFFLLDCATLDEAVAIAAECPAAAWCTVEVRQLGPCFD